MYDTLILVDAESQITAAAVKAELDHFYASTTGRPLSIDLRENEIHLSWMSFTLAISRSALPHVLEESAEIAAHYAAGNPDADKIAACPVRFEVSATDDPDMRYFNDFLYVIQSVQKLGTAYAFDPVSGSFI